MTCPRCHGTDPNCPLCHTPDDDTDARDEWLATVPDCRSDPIQPDDQP